MTRFSIPTSGASWEEVALDSFAGIVENVGEAAVDRLLIDPTARERLEVDMLLEKGGASHMLVGDANAFYFAMILEAGRLGVMAGYGLAKTEPGLSSFESWLSNALETAGLTNYQRPEWIQRDVLEMRKRLRDEQRTVQP